MNRKHEDWIDVLREAATSGREEKLPEGLWNRISESLDAPKINSFGSKSQLYIWTASVAAAGLIALGLFTIKTSVNDIPTQIVEPVIISANIETPAEPLLPVSNIAPRNNAPVNRFVEQVKEDENLCEEPQTMSVNIDESSFESVESEYKAPHIDTEHDNKSTANISPICEFDQFSVKKPRGRKMMLAFSTNGVASVSNTSGGGGAKASAVLRPTPEKLMIAQYEQYSYRHRQPLTFAIVLDVAIGQNLFVGAGVSYTMLSSKVSLANNKEFKQQLQYVGIPVSFKWSFLNTRHFMLYTGIEAQAEFCVGAKFGSQKPDVRTMQWSAHFVAGAQVNLVKYVGIYVEPKLSHYFLDSELKTIRNTKGVNFNLQLGLRFSY